MDLWQDDTPQAKASGSPLSDVVFRIRCDRLPVDHAQALGAAIEQLAPWIRETEGAGVHPIYVAGSQNGWERPSKDSGEDLILSRRTKLTVRTGSEDADRLIDSLCARTVDVGGHAMEILSGRNRPLQPADTLYSRNVYFREADNTQDDEGAFVNAVVKWCMERGFKPTRLLSGKQELIQSVSNPIVTRSVLLANVPAQESLMLQATGLGEHRMFGCGILVPHKSTAAVYDPSE